jgi:hypothetical protein
VPSHAECSLQLRDDRLETLGGVEKILRTWNFDSVDEVIADATNPLNLGARRRI